MRLGLEGERVNLPVAQECAQAAPVIAGAATGRPHRQGLSSQVSIQDRTPWEVAQQGHGFPTSHRCLVAQWPVWDLSPR